MVFNNINEFKIVTSLLQSAYILIVYMGVCVCMGVLYVCVHVYVCIAYKLILTFPVTQ